jgi:demethylmenaquinone methyltransferase / 2-methoxy-6-polyprenyl-1,4-benzoquinol methylase
MWRQAGPPPWQKTVVKNNSSHMQKPSQLTGNERSAYVQAMFSRIARRYDLMNRLMTAGRDRRWREEAALRAALSPGDRLLDLGTGTGDLALEARRQAPGSLPVAADFTIEMMRTGQARLRSRADPPLAWCTADALHLPFPEASFEAVISGFLMRNVGDLNQALAEQRRVLKPGGRIVVLDTTRPQRSLLTPLIQVHFHLVIPLLGRLIAGSGEAYRYLPDSTQAFLSAEELAGKMAASGFQQVGFNRRMLGAIAIHWGVK